MKPEVKKKWIDALRSGEYTQGRHMLQSEVGTFCTLGVLIDLAVQDGVCSWGDTKDRDNEIINGDTSKYYEKLPDYVADWAGLDSTNPNIYIDGTYYDITWLNDIRKYQFDRIANLIEEQL